jgi:hypothetical protein
LQRTKPEPNDKSKPARRTVHRGVDFSLERQRPARQLRLGGSGMQRRLRRLAGRALSSSAAD